MMPACTTSAWRKNVYLHVYNIGFFYFYLCCGGTHVAHCIPLILGVKYIFWDSRLKRLLQQLPPPRYILTAFGQRMIGAGNGTKWCTELEAPNFVYCVIELMHGHIRKVACTCVDFVVLVSFLLEDCCIFVSTQLKLWVGKNTGTREPVKPPCV